MNDFLHNYIFNFPKSLQFQAGDAVDEAIKLFAREHEGALSAIRRAVISVVSGVRWALSSIPWVVLVLLVAAFAWWLTRKLRTGLLYGAMLTFVGCCGLWSQMLETISIVILGVVISVLIGFPLGVLIAMSARASRFMRPILDTMQTMPSWVYLVPAAVLFLIGTTPALLATVIYSVVPMVRMTSHGLRYVDREMVEAAHAFGSTRMQTLIKVQIPQAMPTIMAGVNQTIMMAMAMVVTCALIGANGLGMEILIAVNRMAMGKALLPGVCIVILAVILDRLTQAAAKRSEEHHDG